MNLLNRCYDGFPSLIKIWFSERNAENMMSDLYFNEENDYSEKNTSDNEDFCFTILQQFPSEPEQKKMYCNESHEKETKPINTLAVNFLLIRIRHIHNIRHNCAFWENSNKVFCE